MYLINESPQVTSNSVEAEFQISRRVYLINESPQVTSNSVEAEFQISRRVYLINESPQVTSNSVEAEFQISRPVAGVRRFLRSELDRILWQNCMLFVHE